MKRVCAAKLLCRAKKIYNRWQIQIWSFLEKEQGEPKLISHFSAANFQHLPHTWVSSMSWKAQKTVKERWSKFVCKRNAFWARRHWLHYWLLLRVCFVITTLQANHDYVYICIKVLWFQSGRAICSLPARLSGILWYPGPLGSTRRHPGWKSLM